MGLERRRRTGGALIPPNLEYIGLFSLAHSMFCWNSLMKFYPLQHHTTGFRSCWRTRLSMTEYPPKSTLLEPLTSGHLPAAFDSEKTALCLASVPSQR